MTDQTIPAGITPEEAKKAREWALHALNKPGASTTAEKAVARVVIGTVPEPRPTLADMTEEEREACKRMQCDTAPNRSVRGFIADIYPGGCRVIERDTWEWLSCSDDMVTPRPDLPRMEWPGDQEPDPAPALAAMIAGMHEEWGVAYRLDHENEKRTTWGWETREDAERSMRLMTDVHVYGPVRRYVTEPEEIS